MGRAISGGAGVWPGVPGGLSCREGRHEAISSLSLCRRLPGTDIILLVIVRRPDLNAKLDRVMIGVEPSELVVIIRVTGIGRR